MGFLLLDASRPAQRPPRGNLIEIARFVNCGVVHKGAAVDGFIDTALTPREKSPIRASVFKLGEKRHRVVRYFYQ